MREPISLLIYGAYLFGMLITSSVYAYTPKAEKVTENIYAFIGSLGQRSEDNDGINNKKGSFLLILVPAIWVRNALKKQKQKSLISQ